MKIAIAAEGKNLDSEISVRAGRAPFYLIFEDKKMLEAIKNPFAVGGGGAGWSVAHMLVDKGVNLVIAGEIGPNMIAALKDKGLDYKEESGKKISEVID
jgi:predicted Fe-Mo cluster-binding NifX family protein